ncbi:hypothetical protein [Limosilactobacillus reuteri]
MTDDDFTTRLLTELNLDDVDETRATINNLMKQARAVLVSAINSNVDLKAYMNDDLFLGALDALTTQLFYDRTLENNFSLGVQMMLVQLQAKYIDTEEGEDNGNAQDS